MQPYANTGTSALNALGSLYGLSSATNNGSSGTNQTQFDGTTVTPSTSNGSATTNTAQYAGLYNSPDYQFALTQGIGSLDKSAAASGRLYSAGYGKDLTNYAQGLASTQLTNYANRLQGIAGIGQAAAAGTAAAGNTYAAGTTALNTASGNAAATNAINQGNILNNGVNQLASAYGTYSNGGYG